MGCTIVVGGQFGSEGKGKVVALCAARAQHPWVVRCGGPNSGHTVGIGGREIVLRQVPAGAAHPTALLLVSAGCAVDEARLLKEMDDLNLPRERVVIDPRAVLVTEADRAAEEPIVGQIGSTASGTGAALMRRMARRGDVPLAGSSERLRARARVESVAPLLHDHLDRSNDVIVEGTQGFGLSLLHGTQYPYATSRDTTASGFAMEVGLSPREVTRIVMVIRTFPIRVGGNSGPLGEEITWEQVRASSGAPETMPEYTSVTRRLRRVARFDLEMVKTACRYNRPTSLALMGLDRIEYANTDARSELDLTESAKAFIRSVERETKIAVEWVGTGFRTEQAIRLNDGMRHE